VGEQAHGVSYIAIIAHCRAAFAALVPGVNPGGSGRRGRSKRLQ
jgi:hypothetical protein